MQLSSGSQIPDGLLAAMTLRNENSRLGVPSKNPALHQGIDASKSQPAMGLQTLTTTTRVRSRSTGKERDTESGLDYFGARYYGSSMGRFMSPDWSSLPVGVPYASIGNPQSLNLYSYVLNNPLSHRDLDGHSCAPDTSSTGKDGSVTVTAGACTPDWWQFQSIRRWVGQHPKTVKATFAVVNTATVVSGLLDGGASELAVPEELIAEDAILEAGEVAAEEAGQSAATANKIIHIFDKAEHGLDGVVKASGGKAEAFQALQKATSEATQGVSGQFEKVVQVAGQNVTVRGVVINGEAKIGTAFIPKP